MTPPTNSLVHWLGRTESRVRPDLRVKFTAELGELFGGANVVHITVHDCFAGYGTELDDKAVLGVEVRAEGRVDSHIVKLGDADKVLPDLSGWKACVGDRYVGGRIFVKLDGRPLSQNTRGGIIYEDAYLLFGLDPRTQGPQFLEEVAWWAINDGKPDPSSVERVVRQVFGDLQRWFYHVARPDAVGARTFYVGRLSKALRAWSPRERTIWAELSPGPADPAKVERLMTLRTDATWLLGGLDAPDTRKTAVYLDPYDYVCWALENEQVPSTLVGPSHGDLHGHNVLVGVRRGEAEFPVVIDYGDMARTNVLAWDFVKLEMELKTRILPRLFRDKAACEALLADRKGPPPREATTAGPTSSEARNRAERARRLAFCFEFEVRLADAADSVDSQLVAESLEPPGQGTLFPLDAKVDRALRILLRIRQEAALSLGFSVPGRDEAWREELNFALAVYGLATTKWSNYTKEQTESALVSAGVAAARLETARRALQEHSSTRPAPSYRIPLARAHQALEAGDTSEAIRVIKEAREDFPHAAPLQTEQALTLAEANDLRQAATVVEPLQELCDVFGDHETLGRIGRIYKNLGDRAWTRRGSASGPVVEHDPAWQFYHQALGAYEKAYLISGGEPYPGVNVATLVLLIGESDRARQLAQEILETCRGQPVDGSPQERYDLFASEGEAALILGLADPARDYYENALAQVGRDEIRRLMSSWDQMCRLWHVLDHATLEPVIETFRSRTECWSILPPGPLGDCGLSGNRA
jgi:tetratricopeptide (TPR) repeat protein